MGTNTIRRLAADIMGAGESRVRFNPDEMSRINEALTRDDVRALIKEGLIFALPIRGVSRAGARQRAEGKRVGRHSGHGKRKGTAAARGEPKETWMAKVRSQRKLLFKMREEKAISPDAVRKIYAMIKGNAFRGKMVMRNYLNENKMLTESGHAAHEEKKNAKKTETKKVETRSNTANKTTTAKTAAKSPTEKGPSNNA